MNRELFGTDGMRGQAGDYPLDAATVKTVGQAIGSQFTDGAKPFLVGQDPRESSPAIVKALIDGLTAVGCQVKLVGVLPTPGLAYLTQSTGAAAGVMVTASHNPYTDNGIKVFKAGGQKLTDEEEAKLNQAITNPSYQTAEGSVSQAEDLVEKYVDFLVEAAGEVRFDGLKIAVDSANGAASSIAPMIFEKLGAKVTSLSDQPDGHNINVDCGATNTAAIRQVVKDEKLDAGVALDGDADRLIMIDGQGREFGGDYILYALALQMKVPAVVSTVMSNYGLEKSLASHGIKLHRTQVGDRYVLEELRKHNLKLGGEQSGHIIIFDKQPTGDALLAAVEVLAGVKKSGKSLAQWRDEAVMVPQAVVNFVVSNKQQVEAPEIQKLIKARAAELEGSGRLLIRASGTEPKIRVMVEGADAPNKAELIAEELKAALAKL